MVKFSDRLSQIRANANTSFEQMWENENVRIMSKMLCKCHKYSKQMPNKGQMIGQNFDSKLNTASVYLHSLQQNMFFIYYGSLYIKSSRWWWFHVIWHVIISNYSLLCFFYDFTKQRHVTTFSSQTMHDDLYSFFHIIFTKHCVVKKMDAVYGFSIFKVNRVVTFISIQFE